MGYMKTVFFNKELDIAKWLEDYRRGKIVIEKDETDEVPLEVLLKLYENI